MVLQFKEYTVRKIVNIHKHVDGPWFWCKYTAHPYVGCRSGCEFCYQRGGRYLGRRDPDSYDKLIRVKTNAVELLRKELSRLEKEIITVGDWQAPAERRYGLSRGMLEAVLDADFPLFVVERSPMLLRDLDLLVEINRQMWVGVMFSISNVDPALKRAFEPRSPGVKLRLRAMEKLAEAGITVGTALMPVIPVAGDDDTHLEDAIKATREHGGSFVVAGGMTMDGVQAARTLAAARKFDPRLADQWRKLFRWAEGGVPTYSPPGSYNARLGLKVRELCTRYGLRDRMPRYIARGPLAINKRIAERLFLKTYDLELEEANIYQIWAHRKAAWGVDECPLNVADLYRDRGEAGLRELPGVGGGIARQIAAWLKSEIMNPPFAQRD
ncbi:MAG: radical SAM protein [Chloroflexi bacterium]|nr:radical SAM protein [Chloroflexota bacterium]